MRDDADETDMVRFVASGGGSIEDLYSAKKSYTPGDFELDDEQSYRDTEILLTDQDTYGFTAFRDLVTGDEQDF